jgi:hypothetical protein
MITTRMNIKARMISEFPIRTNTVETPELGFVVSADVTLPGDHKGSKMRSKKKIKANI